MCVFLHSSGLQQPKGGCAGLGPAWKEEASVNFLRGGGAGRRGGCPGLRIRPPGREGAELGGASPRPSPDPGRSPAPRGPGSAPPAGDLGAGRRAAARTDSAATLTVSPVAGGAERGVGGGGGSGRDIGEPRGESMRGEDARIAT